MSKATKRELCQQETFTIQVSGVASDFGSFGFETDDGLGVPVGVTAHRGGGVLLGVVVVVRVRAVYS